MDAILKRVRAELARAADEETRRGAERYFKGAVAFRGIKRAGVTAIERRLRPALQGLSHDERVQLAFTLLRAETMEDRQVGLGVLARALPACPDRIVDQVAALFDDVVRDWASCDMLCGKVLRPLLVRSADARKRIVAWSRAPNPWRKRAAAVAFVNEARTGHHDAAILQVCARLVKDPHRFVQLGCGWVLRELFLASPVTTRAFLEKHMESLSREGLRYAMEKMPAGEQRRLLALHARKGPTRAARRKT